MKTEYSSSPDLIGTRSYHRSYNIFRSMFSLIARTIIVLFFLLFSTPAFAQQATLSLSPSSGTFNKSCPFTLDIVLATGGAQTDGTDAILIYDPSRFSATSITAGTLYPDYPGNNIDDTNGKITISGLASVSSAFSGQGTLATISLKVKDTALEGASQVKFDFDASDKAKTTDSNVVQRGTVADILNSVVNGNYIVGSGSCAVPSPGPRGAGPGGPGSTATPSAGQPPTQPSARVLPPGGTPELTFTLAIVGSVLTVLGILGLAVL